MSFALLLRQRRRLMQFDPTKSITASSTKTGAPGVAKRPYAQQATAALPKVPRLETSGSHSSFSSSRNSSASTGPSLLSPAFDMPPSAPTQAPRSHRAFGSRGAPSSSRGAPSRSVRGRGKSAASRKILSGPIHDEAYIMREYGKSASTLKPTHQATPKASLGNFSMLAKNQRPTYTYVEGLVSDGQRSQVMWRTTVTIPWDTPVVGVGDHPEKKQSERLAASSAVYQLHESGLLDNIPRRVDRTEVALSDSTVVTYERARNFMDYYCRTYRFSKPDITFNELRSAHGSWEAIMTVGDRRIGLGDGTTKKAAQVACYLDVTHYLESCDPDLWKSFVAASKTGADLGLAPRVQCQMSGGLNEQIRDLCAEIRTSHLYRNSPVNARSSSGLVPSTQSLSVPFLASFPTGHRSPRQPLAEKSDHLCQRRLNYLADPKLEKMREARMSLPVFTRAAELMSHIENNDVTICMAATGSGKTTQIPQLILDGLIDQGQGAHCNIICTQPRRLAAISVADRISKERGEPLGRSVGYQVRFEARLPEEHGSITFCTTGIFLKRLQSALSDTRHQSLDHITHVIVDEVHERDVDTDLLLVVLKRLLDDRKARGKPLKIVLMSATIDPTLFQKYFLDDQNKPANVIEIPGRSFPVTKHFMDDFMGDIVHGPARWILSHDSVAKYITKELGAVKASALGVRGLREEPRTEDLDLPYPLIGATIAHIIKNSTDGHVLVFLPGWDDITAVRDSLTRPMGPLGLNFGDMSQYSIHLLHSTIPLQEQQVIFEPPAPGVRRIILATNIAETSITIPDVVYVVDTAKIKEQRYDPERHMSSLVSAWVGSSNLNQRAGRAGRHRLGEYYGILSRAHAEGLHPYQTVEMKRVDLSNVVMHVKALNFPGMGVEEVLAAAIEPPHPERVGAAIKDLQMVGALDSDKTLTSLGRVLLQLPVEAQMGRLVLYGSFFRCLDQALTLAAILTNRDPFVSPMHLKQQSAEKKNSWTPQEFRSDAIATLQAYNAWWALQSRGEYVTANRFCVENFLAKPTLLMIQKIKGHLLQSLYHAGVIDISAGGSVNAQTTVTVPPELNTNGDSLPLLAALISIASQPRFAIRTGDKTLRTSQDRTTFIHPSSVNHRKRDHSEDDSRRVEKQLFAYAEKRQNVSSANSGSAQTFLMTTTKLDPMTYMLFGAYKLEVAEAGLECDSWLPITGDLDALDDIERLKTLMESCMLRVFEGITLGRSQSKRPTIYEEPETGDENDARDLALSHKEITELDMLTRDVVNILNQYSEERAQSQSRQNSRPATPMGSPSTRSIRLLGGSISGYSTPNHHSRPGTPSRLGRLPF